MKAWRSSWSCCSCSAPAIRLKLSPSRAARPRSVTSTRWPRCPLPNARAAWVSRWIGRSMAPARRRARNAAMASEASSATRATSACTRLSRRVAARSLDLPLRARRAPRRRRSRSSMCFSNTSSGSAASVPRRAGPAAVAPELASRGLPLAPHLRAADRSPSRRRRRSSSPRSTRRAACRYSTRSSRSPSSMYWLPAIPAVLQVLEQAHGARDSSTNSSASCSRSGREQQQEPARVRPDDRGEHRGGEHEQATTQGRRPAGRGRGFGAVVDRGRFGFGSHVSPATRVSTGQRYALTYR